MKKLLCLLLCLSMLSGCSKNKTVETLMIMTNQDEYTLYDVEGEKLSTTTYKTYKENYKRGYLVTDTEDQKAYIDYEGDVIVDFGEYDDVSFAADMIVCVKTIQQESDDKKTSTDKTKQAKTTKKTEDTTKTKNTAVNTDQSFILNSEGKTIFTATENETLKISGLPIINDNGTWKVLYKDGEELYSANEEVYYASHDSEYSMYLVALENKIIVYSEVDNELKSLEIEISGNYVISDTTLSSCVLYDKTQKVMIYVNYREGTQCTIKKVTADKIYFDESNNVIVKHGSNVSVLSVNENTLRTMNTYYKDAINYINRSNVTYGPHTTYVEGKATAELENCQVYPAALKLDGDYFPVYIKKGGYQFYSLDGSQPFTTTYYDAEAFDKNNRAIVKDAENSTFLISENGTAVNDKKYFSIKYIGSSYYAVYNEEGQFGVIDKDGKEILSIGYTSLLDQSVFNYNGKEYLMVEKYGRTYVYDTTDDFEEVFSQEGDTVFNEKGYFVVNGESYYTFEGKLIH